MKKTLTLALCALFTFTMIGCKTSGSDKKEPTPETQPVKNEAPKETTAKVEEKQEPCADEDEMCRVERLGDVTFGWLVSDLTPDQVVRELGVPETREDRFEEGASGDFVESWRWESKGIELEMTAPDMTSDVTGWRHVTVWGPFPEKTPRGIGIGSTEEEVREAYAGMIEESSSRPGELIVAGSVFGGAFFRIEDGKVASIFVGAGAE